MASELVVDFPLKRNHAHVDVRFAKTAQLHNIVHKDNSKNELWYTKAEYNSMERNIKQDVLQVRSRANDSASEEDRGFWIGIAHLLTCAILSEQAIQVLTASASLRSEDIALASSAETRRAVLRARKLGKLQQYSIREYAGNL